MKQLDLGSGAVMRAREGYDCYGVDINTNGNDRVKYADLALDPVPYGDNEFDLVTAYDFFEHIPMAMYIWDDTEKKNVRRHCMIELFNGIYAVIKDGGELYMQTPCYPAMSVFQDPDHMSVWTTETLNYFSGDYYGYHDFMFHASRFQKIEQHIENGHLYATLRAIKHLPEDAPYTLTYA